MSAAPLQPLAVDAGRPSLGRLTRVEGRKMLDMRAGALLLGLTLLAAVGGALGRSLGTDGTQAEATDVFLTALAAASVLLPIVGLLLITAEWSQRTALITFAVIPQRFRVIAAKIAAAVTVSLAVAAICLLLGLVCGAALGSGSELDGSAVANGILYLVIGMGIGVALALAVQSTPLAIVLLFAGPILISVIGVISPTLAEVADYLDQTALTDLIDPGARSLDWGRIGANVGFWVALPLALGLIRLRRDDID